MYKNGTSTKELSEIYSVGTTSISYWLKKNDISIRPRDTGRYQKYPFDLDFFQKSSPNLSYFYGFVLGDGCLTQNAKRNMYQISIQVKSSDDIILRKFCQWTKRSEDSINYSKGMSQLRFNSTYLFKGANLQEWRIVPNKTYLPVKPNVQSFCKSFIVGLIDADGCILYKIPENILLQTVLN